MRECPSLFDTVAISVPWAINNEALSNDEIYAIHVDHYLNVDDDEYSPLGDAIAKDHTHFTVDDIFDDDDDD